MNKKMKLSWYWILEERRETVKLRVNGYIFRYLTDFMSKYITVSYDLALISFDINIYIKSFLTPRTFNNFSFGPLKMFRLHTFFKLMKLNLCGAIQFKNKFEPVSP